MKTPQRDWNERTDKIAAVLDVLKHILSPPAPDTYQKISQRLIESDTYARLLFEDIGKVSVPDHARIVFLATSQFGKKDDRSLVVEMPPATMHLAASPDDLIHYVHCGHDVGTSSKPRRDWNNPDEKTAAIADVLRHLFTQPPELRERCLKDDECSAALFRNPRIGNINVPKEAKTIFVPPGEREREIRGSLVIVVPPQSAGTPSDDQLLRYVQCCYRLW